MNLVSALFSFKWLHFSGSYVLGATSCPNLPHFFLLLLEGMFLPISHIKLYLRAGAIPKSVTLILLVETGTLHLVEMDLRLGLVELGLLDRWSPPSSGLLGFRWTWTRTREIFLYTDKSKPLLCSVVGHQFLLSGVVFSFPGCFIDVLVMLLGAAHTFVWRWAWQARIWWLAVEHEDIIFCSKEVLVLDNHSSSLVSPSFPLVLFVLHYAWFG